ncbi:multicopper oxidase domain-containing protein, partial [Niastella vici]|uniref:multicopper oxidase domain-containing protein n=1 Tax=Niastella vici TaxID=1703345 RepID=UPI001FE5838D
MKNIFLIILLFISWSFSRAQQQASKQEQPVIYTCVMHPEVRISKPGNCPKCGMKLVKAKNKAVEKPTPDKKQMPTKDTSKKVDNMEHMQMPSQQDKLQIQPVTYTCPMHPEIHATKPGNCPKCGMKLVREKTTISPQADHQQDSMQMPLKDSATSMGKIDSVKMDGMDMGDNGTLAENIKTAKANLGPVKTIDATTPPRTVRYDLYIADTTVNFGGKPKRAIAVNGQIPMPTLTFTEGDTAEIYMHNNLDEETALHWHGLFLPNRMDGVPNLTQMPIKPHTTYLYKFPIVQHGTHWYHSHSGLQEQIGMYGAFIMNKRKEWDIPTIPIVLSDWTNMKPEEVNRSLHAATDWFA